MVKTREEKAIINGATYVAEMMVYDTGMSGFFRTQEGFNGVFGGLVSINHPIYGLIKKEDIDKPFKIKGSPFNWKLKALHVGQIELEAKILCGLFTRKITKFI